MSSFGKNIYTLKIIQKKLQKYFKRNYKNNRKEFIRKVWRLNEDGERDWKSNIILLERVADILSEQWYNERKTNISDESERVIRTAAKLVRGAIENKELQDKWYPAANDTMSKGKNAVPHLSEAFLKEFVKSPIKHKFLSVTINSAARPKSLMPLQFRLGCWCR